MTRVHLLIAIAVAWMWGFNFSVIKLGVEGMDPLILAGLRFTFAAIPAVFIIKKPQVSWSILALYGLTFGVGVWGMLTLSIHLGVSAGMSSLILQSSAFISVLLGVIFLKEKLSLFRKVGLLISIFGLSLIFTLQDGSITLIGILFACFASVSFSLVGLIIKKVTINDMFAFVVWSCIFAPVPLFVLSFMLNGSSGYVSLLNNMNYLSAFSVLFQAYPVTLLGYWLWNKLVAQYPMSTMAPLTLLVPLFALLGSAIFYNEQIGMTKLLACICILSGIAFGFIEGVAEPLIKKLKLKVSLYRIN
jgi:O-acetylserine/cysteine efflux transporter